MVQALRAVLLLLDTATRVLPPLYRTRLLLRIQQLGCSCLHLATTAPQQPLVHWHSSSIFSCGSASCPSVFSAHLSRQLSRKATQLSTSIDSTCTCCGRSVMPWQCCRMPASSRTRRLC